MNDNNNPAFYIKVLTILCNLMSLVAFTTGLIGLSSVNLYLIIGLPFLPLVFSIVILLLSLAFQKCFGWVALKWFNKKNDKQILLEKLNSLKK